MGILRAILIIITIALIVAGVMTNDNTAGDSFAILLLLLFLIYLVLS